MSDYRWLDWLYVVAASWKIYRMSESRRKVVGDMSHVGMPLQLVVLCSSCVTIMKNVTGFPHRHNITTIYILKHDLYPWRLLPKGCGSSLSNSNTYRWIVWANHCWHLIPDSKVHGTNMGPTWAPSAPGGPHDGPINLAKRDGMSFSESFNCP